jgi:2-keto-4-pentenoate hydratase
VQLSPEVVDALRAQLAARSAPLVQGARPVGWKVAASIPGVAANQGTDGAISGRTVWNMARLLGEFDQQLHGGDRIIGGSLIHLSVEAGHELSATIEGLGEASLHIDS